MHLVLIPVAFCLLLYAPGRFLLSPRQLAAATPGSRLLREVLLRNLDSDAVLPAFHHLIAVWIATFHALTGSPGAAWVITLFAGLSVWSIVAFTLGTMGQVAGVSCFGLLLFLSPQYWYSRFLM